MTRSRILIIGPMLACFCVAGCGLKGPPLPPLRPVPVAPTQVFASRGGDRVAVRLMVPEANTDPATPVSISAVEIYARTLPFGSPVPTIEQLLQRSNLVGTIDVRPAPPAAGESAAPEAIAPAVPPDPRPGPGDLAVWSETIPTAAPRPLELTRGQRERLSAERPIWMAIRPTGLFVPVTRLRLPTRYYVAIGVSEHRRPGRPSAVMVLPYGPAPPAPGPLTITVTETQLTLEWTTSEPLAPVTVVETTRDGVEQPTPVQAAPITSGSWSTPVTFGVERCFVIRQVVRRPTVSVESATVGPVCETPRDIFGPPAPTGIVGVAGPDGVSLLWDTVSAADLAGYLVLRAEGTAEAQQLTPTPITSQQFLDATARPGVRYVYFVVAVDATGNQGTRSEGIPVQRFLTAGRQIDDSTLPR